MGNPSRQDPERRLEGGAGAAGVRSLGDREAVGLVTEPREPAGDCEVEAGRGRDADDQSLPRQAPKGKRLFRWLIFPLLALLLALERGGLVWRGIGVGRMLVLFVKRSCSRRDVEVVPVVDIIAQVWIPVVTVLVCVHKLFLSLLLLGVLVVVIATYCMPKPTRIVPLSIVLLHFVSSVTLTTRTPGH